MNNFNVFLIGLDVILMALAGYYLFIGKVKFKLLLVTLSPS